mmetsp:Transcript_12496/g.48688  ORF Transcript_12496/g.48688 Transcript_12496/m.48688 type:complete len:315 (+) Transcript_12496:1953-2897(+)
MVRNAARSGCLDLRSTVLTCSSFGSLKDASATSPPRVHESRVPSSAGTLRSSLSERKSQTSLLRMTELPVGWKHAPPPSLNLSNFCTGCGSRTSHNMFPHSTMPPSPGLKHTSANLAALLSLGAALAEMCAGVNVKTTSPEEQSTNLAVPTRSSPTTMILVADGSNAPPHEPSKAWRLPCSMLLTSHSCTSVDEHVSARDLAQLGGEVLKVRIGPECPPSITSSMSPLAQSNRRSSPSCEPVRMRSPPDPTNAAAVSTVPSSRIVRSGLNRLKTKCLSRVRPPTPPLGFSHSRRARRWPRFFGASSRCLGSTHA